MITQSIQQQSIGISPISPFATKLEVEVDITGDSVLWFYPYLASDFPEVTCDKTYFFLWSTDHDQGLTGGLYWGKGNNLDLSDFEEIGLIRDGYQAETPLLYRFPDQARPIFLYYHTIHTNPLNVCGGIGQETNLMTTTGGLLHTATWTDETNPLGCQVTIGGLSQGHTGYLNFWNVEGNLIGYHHFGNTAGDSYYQKSTTSDGKFWFHNFPYSKTSVSFGDNRWWVFNWATFFTRSNQLWMFINSADVTNNFAGGSVPSGQLHLIKVDRSLDLVEKVADLTDDEQQSMTVYIEGDTAHIYRQTGRPDMPDTFTDFLSYSQFDLKALDYL